MGWKTDAINLKLITQYSIIECYKKILTDIADWKDSWTGPDAKWVDSCAFSSGGQEITIQDWQLSQATSSKNVIGGTEINGPGCFVFA